MMKALVTAALQSDTMKYAQCNWDWIWKNMSSIIF